MTRNESLYMKNNATQSGRTRHPPPVSPEFPVKGCIKPQSILESNQKIRPVKPGPTWSKLKLFPRQQPGVPTTTQTLRSLRLFYPPPFRLLPSRFVFFHPPQSGCYGGRVVCFCGDPRIYETIPSRTHRARGSKLLVLRFLCYLLFKFREPFLHRFLHLCRHLRCKSTTYDPKLHHTKSPTLNPQHSTLNEPTQQWLAERSTFSQACVVIL